MRKIIDWVRAHKKATIIGAVVVVIVGAFTLSSVNEMSNNRSAQEAREAYDNAQAQAQRSQTRIAPEDRTPSWLSQALGLEDSSNPYRITEGELVNLVSQVMAFDSNSESHDAAVERVRSVSVADLQNQGEQGMTILIPNEKRWADGWSRTFRSDGARAIEVARGGSSKGEVETWVVNSYMTLYKGEDVALEGSERLIVDVQCVGETLDTCRLIALQGDDPMGFDLVVERYNALESLLRGTTPQ